MSGISEQTWQIEKAIAQHEIATTGHLPTGNDLGGRFWDMVSSHYEVAKNTGHLARFDYYHCPFVVNVETTAHTTVTPVVQPTTPVAPAMPYVPPVTPITVVPPIYHTPVAPYCPVVPVTPGPTPVPSAVPEPSSLVLALPIVFVTGAYLVWKRMLRFAAI